MTLEDRIESHLCPRGASVFGSQLPAQQAVSPSPAFVETPTPSPPGLPGPLLYPACHNNNHSPPNDTELESSREAKHVAGGLTPERSRNGLTTTSVGRELSGVGSVSSPAKNATAVSATEVKAEPEREAESKPGGPPGSLGKHPSEREKHETLAQESPSKKQRLAGPGSISLPPLPRTEAEAASSAQSDIASPLFFSNSAKRMTPRPGGFTGSGIPAHIMGPIHESRDGVTTLRLPKGQLSTASPRANSGSSSTPGSWTSGEMPESSRSPESRPFPSVAPVLQNIGVVELLEQDERPTFIIDLTNSDNFNPGPLQIVFANASLRAAPGILELLRSDTAELGHSSDFARFKAWAVSFVKNTDSMDAYLPSLAYEGVTWSCSTVRKRFRFISGNASSVSITPTPFGQTREQKARVLTPDQQGQGQQPETPETNEQDGDYFGPVELPESPAAAASARTRAHSEPKSRPEPLADVPMLSSDDLELTAGSPPMQLQMTFDWTRIPPDDPNLGAHHRFARSIDWESTSLGPVEEWPADLRIMSNMIMGSPHPAAMYWGPDYVAIYNEAYIALAGQKHPQLMGARYKDAWSELWDEIGPVLDAAWQNGVSTMKYDDELLLTRHGFLEETFFNWAIIPLVGGDGSVVALYNPAFENTRRKINERRMLTLREVGVKTSQARDVKGFWGQVQKGLEYNGHDVPFALIYSVADDGESDASSMNSGSLSNPPQIVLQGSLGVPDGHPSALSTIDLRTSDDGFAPYLRESMAHTENPVVLNESDGTLPTELIRGLAWRGPGEPCRTVVVFPVHPITTGDMVVGFMILGVNPRRQYDKDYELFVNLLSRQLATSMASVVLFEEEIKRGQRAARLAALDRQRLSMQLHLRTQEAVESEYRFTRMAEFGPVGLFIADGSGHINYCNEMWWKISGHERTASTLDAWMQSIRDEDRQGVEGVWCRLVDEKVAVTHEFRFKGFRKITEGHTVDTWALMSAYPEKDELGELKSIFGCITDISQQKWAEDFQKQRRDEAVELKRQQENFIDITSHEMRNPLSAILQCADEIASGLTRYRMEDPASQVVQGALNTLLDSCVEAANTISLCASHQKRIVDDILTLSKLDSNLLLVTPVDVQPITVVQNVLRIFEAELASNDITGHFLIQQSYRDLAIDWVKLDPSRLRQVLINLMTNAVKFTQGRPIRSIVISLGASKEVASSDVSYFPPRHPEHKDITDEPDWADGEKINLHLAVSDTGPGLDDEEKKILFQRFSQASPRTHVQYGGSGLGLFICRILTELQGGQIGVQTQKGEGSTFAFYIKSRRSDHHPDDPDDQAASIPTPGSSPPKQPVTTTSVAAPPPPKTIQYPTKAPHPTLQLGSSASFRDQGVAVRSLDILIVEDNLVNQRVLQRQLQLSGNKTYVANHGGEALEKLRRSRFWNLDAASQDNLLQLASSTDHPPGEGREKDKTSSSSSSSSSWNISVILMDLEMPVMDGMTCTREIRRLEDAGVITHHIPIIAVTAYARPEQIENAKVAGVDDVISKPFRIPELIPKIEELVAKYNTNNPAAASPLPDSS